MSKLNLNELHAPLKEKEKIRNDIYDQVLKRCHNRIKIIARQPNTFCYFVIPEFLLGVPLYNYNECRHYIIHSLRENGLVVNYIEPNMLFISWDIEHVHSKQMDTRNIPIQTPMNVSTDYTMPEPIDSSLSYLAPHEVTKVQEQAQPVHQPVQLPMQQQFRSTKDFKPMGIFDSSKDKLNM